MKLPLLTNNADFLVLDKPISLSVHNDNPREESVLTLLGPGHFPVHRLDKETSGVLLVAKNKTAATRLAEQFQDHRVQKFYTALLRGKLKSAQFDWKWPLTDKAEGRKSPQGASGDRKMCETSGRVVKSNEYLSLAEIQIKTGRQHQIRKHAALAGHALVGDPRYNDPKYNDKIFQRFGIARMFLHAAVLEFTWQGKTLRFESPLPAEFDLLLAESPI